MLQPLSPHPATTQVRTPQLLRPRTSEPVLCNGEAVTVRSRRATTRGHVHTARKAESSPQIVKEQDTSGGWTCPNRITPIFGISLKMQPRACLVVQGLRLSTLTTLGLNVTQGSISDQETKILPPSPPIFFFFRRKFSPAVMREGGGTEWACSSTKAATPTVTNWPVWPAHWKAPFSKLVFIWSEAEFSSTILFPSHLSKTISNHCSTSQQPEAVTTTGANKRVIKKLEVKAQAEM